MFLGISEACAAVLSFPETAARFWQEKDEEGGPWTIIKYAMQWFPYRFEPFTYIVTGLVSASASSAAKTLEVLENLPSITLEVPRRAFGREMQRRPYEQQCVIHGNAFEIPENCAFTKISAAKRTTPRDEYDLILFETKANYWDAFHHRIEKLLLEASGGIANLSESNNALPEQVALGFGLLETLLTTDVDISISMVIPTELSFEIVNRFSYPILPYNIYKVNLTIL